MRSVLRTPLAAFKPPTTFTYPTPEVQLAGTIKGIASVLPVASVPIEDNGILSPPVATLVGGIAGTLQDASNIPFGNLTNLAFDLVALGNATNTVQILTAIGDVFNQTVDVVVDTAEALGAAADVADVIPLVGDVVNLVLGFVIAWAKSEAFTEQATEQCEIDATNHFNSYCNALVQQHQPLASSYKGHVPSDLFRQLAYNRQVGSRQFPANTSSVYLALCGGQAGDFSVVGEGIYNDMAARSGIGGIPVETRQRMWELIKGLMDNVQRAEFGVPLSIDSGRSLMPVLQDIVRTEYNRGTRIGSKTGINDAFIFELSKACIHWTRGSFPCSSVSRKRFTQRSCGVVYSGPFEDPNPRVDLSEPFLDSVRYFDQAMQEAKTVGQKVASLAKNSAMKVSPALAQMINKKLPGRKLVSGGSLVVPAASSANGVLVMSPDTQKLIESIREGQAKEPSKAMGALVAALLGGGAFVLARKAAKR